MPYQGNLTFVGIILFGLILLMILFTGCGYKQYHPQHENYAKYQRKYRGANCEGWKLRQARQCMMSEGRPKAECSLYYMRCTAKPEWMNEMKGIPRSREWYR